MRRFEFLRLRPGEWAVAILVGLFVHSALFNEVDAQTATDSSAPVDGQESAADEYDNWRGSSLGIRIHHDEGMVFVEKVHEHVAGRQSLREGDQIVSVEGIDLNMLNVKKLAELLDKTDPGSELKMQIKRGDESLELQVATFRRQLVDIPEIVRRLKSNQIIKKHLADTGRSDLLDDATGRMVARVQKSQSPREAHEAINAIIDEIDVSHTAFIPARSYRQLRGNDTGELGYTLQRHQIDGKNRYFVIDLMPGTPGYESAIKLGDELSHVNDVEIEKSSRLILAGHEQRHGVFFIRANKDEPIRLNYRRRQNGNAQTTQIIAGEHPGTENVLELSARLILDNDNRIGYVRFWNLMSMNIPKIFGSLVDDKFKDCHVIIIDLRGRGGIIPAVIGVERVVKRIKVPVIAITDNLTRSAKEMLSLRLKNLQNATVVGETTAGAVTGATVAQLPSGNSLMFPAASAEVLKRFTDGAILEGNGVEPDLPVDFQIPYCGGNDRLLEAAIEIANEQVQELLDSIILR